MRRWWWVGLAAFAACGDNDEGLPPCDVTIDGDVTRADECRMFLCYPRGAAYQVLGLGNSKGSSLVYDLGPSLDAPTTFTADQTYTLDDLGPRTGFSLGNDGIQYAARLGAATRDPGESAQLTIQTLHAPHDWPCDGYIDGFLVVNMVEITASGSVGPGRVRVRAILGNPR
jgi:hypothetical protein